MTSRGAAMLAMPIAFSLFALGVLLAFAAHASDAVPTEKDPVAAARAVKLAEKLRCLVCQNQSIDDSNAPLARDLRLLVRERLKAGDSDAKVMQFVEARYGEFVLLRPPFNPSTLLLWLAPILVLIAAIAVGVRAFGGRGPVPAGAAPLSGAEEDKLRKLLAEPRDGSPTPPPSEPTQPG